jgi:hypothetical protein
VEETIKFLQPMKNKIMAMKKLHTLKSLMALQKLRPCLTRTGDLLKKKRREKLKIAVVLTISCERKNYYLRTWHLRLRSAIGGQVNIQALDGSSSSSKAEI